ncbi:uromodulin-like isoform X2 [Crassostrea virginica]
MFPRFRIILPLKVLIISNFCDAFDPCLVGNFNFLLKPGLRGGNCHLQPGKVVCDRFIDDGWYKVLHEDDIKPRKMLEGIVSPSYCGTSFPIWLNGSHPNTVDGIVNRTACMVGVNSFCDVEYDIQIKACAANDYVYNLQKAKTCNAGYCFGVNLPCAKPNPCEPENSKLINVEDDRSTSCKDKSLSLCDNILSNEWYRIQKNDIDLKMPTTCVEQNSCGTVSPIWLNGSEPTLPEKVVSRKACVSNDNACGCIKFYNIEIRNCSTFLVYNLTSTSSCPERFCFGTDGECRSKTNA